MTRKRVCHPRARTMRTTAIMLALAVGTSLCIELGCARRSVPVGPSSVSIPTNQRVALWFERFDEQKEIIWLRLHNWTAWDIRVSVEMHSLEIARAARNHKDGAEVDVRYYLEPHDPRPWMQVTTESGEKMPPDEPEHPPVPDIRRVDFSTEWWIPKDQSILFSVPKEHLARNIALNVYLRYEWENLGAEVLSGPVHLVRYRGIDLPSEVQAHIK